MCIHVPISGIWPFFLLCRTWYFSGCPTVGIIRGFQMYIIDTWPCFLIQLIKSPRVLGLTLCVCTGSYTAACDGICSHNNFWTTFHISFIFGRIDWPWLDCLIRLWSIFIMTLTVNFQDEIVNLLYPRQKWSDCHKTKSKQQIDWTLGLKCHHWVWHWPWPWPWIF